MKDSELMSIGYDATGYEVAQWYECRKNGCNCVGHWVNGNENEVKYWDNEYTIFEDADYFKDEMESLFPSGYKMYLEEHDEIDMDYIRNHIEKNGYIRVEVWVKFKSITLINN